MPSHTNYIIAGRGISGLSIGISLLAKGADVRFLKQTKEAASLSAGALIHPFKSNGKPDDLYRSHYLFALDFYKVLEKIFGHTVCSERKVWKPVNTDPCNVRLNMEAGIFDRTFSGLWISPAVLFNAFKQFVLENDLEINETFDALISRHQPGTLLIDCRGAASAADPLWRGLPFTGNRGDILIIESGTFNSDIIYDLKFRIIPLADKRFWVGTNNAWNKKDLSPDEDWRQSAEDYLRIITNADHKIIAHKTAFRPTTAGQFPFIGLHPEFKGLAIFNGFGSRGFAAAPYYAESFAGYLTGKTSIMSDYDNERFAGFFSDKLLRF